MNEAALSLSLMGTLAIRRGGARQKLPFAGNTRRLFVFLAGHVNAGQRRACVLDTVWPGCEDPRAGSALNTAVWRIKKVLGAYEGISLDIIDDMIRLSVQAPAWVDVEALLDATEAAATRARPDNRLDDACKPALAAALKGCRGEFLEGCAEHWALALRERYGALFIRAHGLMMRDAAAHGDYEVALTHGRTIIERDPFHEGAQRDVMWLLALNGQRARAMQQYAELRRMLKAELGIEPMPETAALMRRIATSGGTAPDLATEARDALGGPERLAIHPLV